MNHTIFIAWAFSRHCTVPHNADFEVCQDLACQRAIKYEQVDMSDILPFTDTSHPTAADDRARLAGYQEGTGI